MWSRESIGLKSFGVGRYRTIVMWSREGISIK